MKAARSTILAIDDEVPFLQSVSRSLENSEIKVVTAPSGKDGLDLLQRHQPDVILLDMRLPDMNGLEVFARIQAMDCKTLVIFITGNDCSVTTIEAMKRGAFDYLSKPLDLAQLRTTVNRALQVGQYLNLAQQQEKNPSADTQPALVGKSPAMKEVYKCIGMVAEQDMTVLVLGENGTGKDLVARTIHRHSRRANKPFLAINCAAIPENLLESELFGHEKGAFTGAEHQHIGKFEQCNGGTLFLDEVGDMSALTQTKILRVLQEQAFERVGGKQTIRTDVRIIAATNQPLDEMAATGQFRQDLFYRLSVFGIALPPLRERHQDMEQLVNHFLTRYSAEMGKQVTHAAPEALAILNRHTWPGNVRELQSVLQQALLRSWGSVLLPDFLPPSLIQTENLDVHTPPAAVAGWDMFILERLQSGSNNLFEDSLEQMERQLLTGVLRRTGGNQVQAAKLLGITRSSLRFKMQQRGLPMERDYWSSNPQGTEQLSGQ